ncbi:putative transcription factor kapC [Naviculisporaceae sp. PSN 640]
MACTSPLQDNLAGSIAADSGGDHVKMEKMEIDPRRPEAPVETSLVNNHVEQHPAFPNPAYPAHSQSPPNGQGAERPSPVQAAHPLPHGYNHAQPTQNESHIHPELRSSHEPAPTPGYAPVPSMMPAGLSPTSDQSGAMSASTTTVVVPAMGGVDNSDGGADGRNKAKRELSQSKRAAQNRAAQRAFRQRKEGYIKKLEQQVREYTEMEINYKQIQAENYSLREYVIHLQSRLLDAQGEFPQPPPNLNLGHPTAHAPPPPGGPPGAVAPGPGPEPLGQPAAVPGTAPGVGGGPGGAANSLEVAAQAVAGLSRGDHLAGRPTAAADPYVKYEPPAGTGGARGGADDDARTAEEITRQLQADGQPDGLPAAPM